MKRFLMSIALLAMVACSPTRDLDDGSAVEPIGNFKLGFAMARVPDGVTKGPVSRTASADEWKAAVQPALERRLSRYSGSELYHVVLSVEGYVLAQPGVPIVASPKSVLIFKVFVVDNETQKVINPDPDQLTVIETFTGGNIFGSGWTSSKEEQLRDLSESAARATEKWLREQDWFDGTAQAALPTEPVNTPNAILPAKNPDGADAL